MDIKDIITITSVFTAFIGLVFGTYNLRKSHYISTVTSSRIKYAENLRIIVSEYSAIAISSIKGLEDKQFLERIYKLNFLIKLHLDRNHPFDSKIIEKVDSILKIYQSDEKHKIETEIDELIELTQDVLYLEWHGIKEEAIKGILRQKKKNELSTKYLKL